MSYWKRLKRRLLHLYLKTRNSDSPPGEIAGGLAIGFFIAFLPVPGHVIIAPALAWAARMRKIPALLGCLLIPAPLWIPLSVLYLKIGRALLDWLPDWLWKLEGDPAAAADPVAGGPLRKLHAGWPHFTAFMLGYLVIAGASALALYFVSRALLVRIQTRRRARRAAAGLARKTGA